MDRTRVPFRLERGATGFRHVSEPLLPHVDVKECRAAWYDAARTAGGEVGDFKEQVYPQNFHSATLTLRDEEHVALFHPHHPLIAFVEDRRLGYLTEFLDPPTWASALTGCGFTVLDRSLLLSPLAAADTSGLTAVEWRQIEYWEPPTVGATLFNWWD